MELKKLWGGRFAGDVDQLTEAFTESVSFDRALYAHDIAGSRAHARMLARVGVLTEDEAARIIDGLRAVQEEIESGDFIWKREMEDVHMNIEARLTELIGPLGKKLHTGRSRNDQVALDFRLFINDRLDCWCSRLAELVRVIIRRAERNTTTLLPGCTHLQAAQPVSLAHHLLAYAWKFKRDVERIRDCQKRVRISPLGAAALAGTTYPIDPHAVAAELGMERTFRNSMDAVSDRDFVIESAACASIIMTHLSGLCEDLIIWANPQFGFVHLPDAYATGSSIMPQKKNPDVAEIIRGKTGRVHGALIAILTIMKGLPLTYNRDMQEDKQPFFDADRTVRDCVVLMTGMLDAMEFNRGRMRQALEDGFLNATELADYLVGKGMAFRDAHEVTGRIVACCEGVGKRLEEMGLDEFADYSDLIGPDVYEALDYENAMRRRTSPGGTGPEAVKGQLERLRFWLEEYEGDEISYCLLPVPGKVD